jgi:hypothetical protein
MAQSSMKCFHVLLQNLRAILYMWYQSLDLLLAILFRFFQVPQLYNQHLLGDSALNYVITIWYFYSQTHNIPRIPSWGWDTQMSTRARLRSVTPYRAIGMALARAIGEREMG